MKEVIFNAKLGPYETCFFENNESKLGRIHTLLLKLTQNSNIFEFSMSVYQDSIEILKALSQSPSKESKERLFWYVQL